MRSFYSLLLTSSGGAAWVNGTDAPGLTSSYSIVNGTQLPSGEVDFTVGFSAFSGTFGYTFESYTKISRDNDQPNGAYGSSVLGANLLGIDAVDAAGTPLSTALFLTNGNATLDMVVATPEPASFPLLATGLIGVGALFRRRRKRHG